MRRSRGRNRSQPHGGRRPQRPLRWGRWLIAALIALPLAFGTGYAIAALVIFPAAAEEANDLVPMPKLSGNTRAEAEREIQALGLTIESVTELPHQSAPAGTVTAQSPLPGQLLHAGAPVRFAISAGRPQLPVPDLVGLPFDNAAAVAERLGFTINRRDEQVPGTAGVVLRIEPAPGTPRELPAAITFFVVAPPDTTEPGLPLPDAIPEPEENRG